MGSLYLLPPAIRMILEHHALHLRQGSIAAHISFAKKYVSEGRHCPSQPVGEEIFNSAESVAHNIFVPRQLLMTSTTQALGHTYWEHRMDLHLGEECLRQA